MSKKIIVATIIILATLGAYIYSNKNSKILTKHEVVTATPQAAMKAIDGKNSTNNSIDSPRYMPYSTQVLENTKSARRVLFFFASWCPTCIPTNADFEKNVSMLPSDLTVIRVNYNDQDTDAEEKALAVKYGITYQHTFVQIDASGNEISKWNGGSLKELLAKIK